MRDATSGPIWRALMAHIGACQPALAIGSCCGTTLAARVFPSLSCVWEPSEQQIKMMHKDDDDDAGQPTAD
jgi:hypothetical protein